MRPESYVEAAGLLRLLFERTYGIQMRAEEREQALEEARLAARYKESKRLIPIDPDYIPE